MSLRRVFLSAALVLAASGARAAVLYDGALGTTPNLQGWCYLFDPIFGNEAVQTARDGLAILDTRPRREDMAGYFSRPPVIPVCPPHPEVPALDRIKGYSLRFDLELEAELHASEHRAGLSLIVLSEDLKGLEIGFWPDEVWVQTDVPLFEHGEGAPLTRSDELTAYELCVFEDGYMLSARGVEVLSGALRDYSAFGPPYDMPSFLFMGDDTSAASARVAIGRVELRVSEDPGAGCPPPRPASDADFTGDGRADLAVYRPETGRFHWLVSQTGFTTAGGARPGSPAAGDVALFGDMDGDGIADPVTWRPATGRWRWRESRSRAVVTGPVWGACGEGDTPLVGDLDGDGRSDSAVWRGGPGAVAGAWYWLESSTGLDRARARRARFGAPELGDRPFLGDMDGDGKSDLVVWRECEGLWLWQPSASAPLRFEARRWGAPGDVPLLADMDGDARRDLVVRRAPSSFLWTTAASGFTDAWSARLGDSALGDLPLALDLDGDARADLAVRRPGSRQYRWTTSGSGWTDLHTRLLGIAGDRVPDRREREAAGGAWRPVCGSPRPCSD